MDTTKFTNQLKDMSAIAKRANSAEVFVKFLDDLTSDQLMILADRLTNYQPKTDSGLDSKKVAVTLLSRYVNDKSKPTFDTRSAGKKVAENSCVLEIHVRQPGFKKKMRSDDFLDRSGNNGHLDPDVLHVSKELIDRRELRDLKALKRNLVSYLASRTVPGGLLTLGNGQYLVPVARIDEIHETIQKFISDRKVLLDEFESRYPSIKEKAKEKLGDFYEEDSYPPFELLRSRYHTEYKFISNTVPEQLARVSQELYKKEAARIEQECAESAQEIRDALREGFKELISHFEDRLGKDDSGKLNVFHASRVEKLKDFLETFADRNLTEDGELANLVSKANDIVSGVDIDSLRDDEAYREGIRNSFSEIKAHSDKLIVKKTRRFDI